MTNYEIMRRWTHVCYVAEVLSRSDKMNDRYKSYLIRNLNRFAFDMYRAVTERIFREPYNF